MKEYSMKLIIIVLSLLLFTTSHCVAKNNSKYSYVSTSHLKKILYKVKKNSNINARALSKAFNYYEKNRYKKGLSANYIAIADYTKTSKEKRLYIINLRNGAVNRHHIAHGKKSGAKGGRVWRSSNSKNTHMTPYGFFKVGLHEGVTTKKRYRYLSVKGLEYSNQKVGDSIRKGGRDILLHTAKYVNWGGRSYGCFAIKPKDKGVVFNRLKTALLYSYTGR